MVELSRREGGMPPGKGLVTQGDGGGPRRLGGDPGGQGGVTTSRVAKPKEADCSPRFSSSHSSSSANPARKAWMRGYQNLRAPPPLAARDGPGPLKGLVGPKARIPPPSSRVIIPPPTEMAPETSSEVRSTAPAVNHPFASRSTSEPGVLPDSPPVDHSIKTWLGWRHSVSNPASPIRYRVPVTDT